MYPTKTAAPHRRYYLCRECESYPNPLLPSGHCPMKGELVGGHRRVCTSGKQRKAAFVPTMKEDTMSESAQEYACPDCGKVLKNSQGLGSHRFRAHGVHAGGNGEHSVSTTDTVKADAGRVATDIAEMAAAEAAESVSGLFADTDEGREALGQITERLEHGKDVERECTEFAEAAVTEAADAGGGSARPTLTVRLAVTRLDSPAEHECDLAQELEEARIQLLSYALCDAFTITADEAEAFIAAHVIPLVEAAETAGESAWRAEVGL